MFFWGGWCDTDGSSRRGTTPWQTAALHPARRGNQVDDRGLVGRLLGRDLAAGAVDDVGGLELDVAGVVVPAMGGRREMSNHIKKKTSLRPRFRFWFRFSEPTRRRAGQ